MSTIPGFTAELTLDRTVGQYSSRLTSGHTRGNGEVVPQGGQPPVGITPHCNIWYFYDVNNPGAIYPVRICY